MRLARHRGQGQRRGSVSYGSGNLTPLPSGQYASPRYSIASWLTHSVITNRLTGEPYASVDPDTYFTGTVHSCSNQTEFTAALAACVDRDVILLTSNITITSTQTMRNRGDSGWVLITSDAFDAAPLTNGIRFNPSVDSALVRSLTSSSLHSVIRCAQGARGYFWRGVKITKDAAATNNGAALINFGALTQSSLAHVPLYMEMRHCWVTNPWTSSGPESHRGIVISSQYTKIRDSYIDGHAVGDADSQGILIHSTPGDFDIHNNYIEGGAENIMIGGVQSSIGSSGTCSNGWIHQNYFHKRLSWNTGAIDGIVVRKNFFEHKVGQKVVWEGNVGENFDGTGQQFDVNIGCKVQSVTEAQNGVLVTQDIWCRANLFKNSAAPLQVISGDNDAGEGIVDGCNRIQVSGNLWHAQGWPTGTNRIQLTQNNGMPDVAIENNTFKATNCFVIFAASAAEAADKMPNFVLQNNIDYGAPQFGPIFSNGSEDSTALNTVCGSGLWLTQRNVVLTNSWDATLAGGTNLNKTAANLAAFGFADSAGGDYTIISGVYLGTGTDGNNPGVDMAFLSNLTAGVVTGNPTL